MTVAGLQKLTLLDYPGKVACTVFIGGCNLRCPFCHNARIVKCETKPISREEFFSYLDKRKGILDGVAITGGEPLMQKDTLDLILKIREKGFLVKLDTNGCFPERLQSLIEEKLVDYVAMDIKNSPEKYAQTVGFAPFDMKKIEQSAALLKQDKVDYEFRTTLVSPLHRLEDMQKIGQWLKGAKRYFLQSFVDSGDLLDGKNFEPVPMPEMEKMQKILQWYISETIIR